MIEIKQTPIPTCKNYGINDFCVDEKLFNVKTSEYQNVKTNIDFEDLKSLPQNSFSAELNSLAKKQNNFAKKININKTDKTDKEIVFDFDQNLIDAMEINIAANIESKIIIKYASTKNVFHSAMLKINVGKNAKLDVVILCNTNMVNANFLSAEINCDTKSQTKLHLIDFCGEISAHNILTNLFGDQSKLVFDSIYFGKDKDRISLNYLINIYGKQCDAKMKVVGTLDNYSQKNFVGTINFLKGSDKSVGEEDEYAILLSSDAKTKATPILLCKEENVDGRHSSSCGKFDDDILFYVNSRGISEADAKKLLVKAKLNGLISSIESEKIKGEIFEQIDKMFA